VTCRVPGEHMPHFTRLRQPTCGWGGRRVTLLLFVVDCQLVLFMCVRHSGVVHTAVVSRRLCFGRPHFCPTPHPLPLRLSLSLSRGLLSDTPKIRRETLQLTLVNARCSCVLNCVDVCECNITLSSVSRWGTVCMRSNITVSCQ